MEFSEIRKHFEEQDSLVGFEKEKKNFFDNVIIKPIEFIDKISKYDPDKIDTLIERIFNSFLMEFLNIEEIIIMEGNSTIDNVFPLNNADLYIKDNYNLSFYNQLNSKISIIKTFTPEIIKHEHFRQIIKQYSEVENKNKVEIIFTQEMMKFLYTKYYCDIMPYNKPLSNLYYLNALLNVKIYFFDNCFEQLLEIFIASNHKGYKKREEVLYYLISIYNKALEEGNIINSFNSFIFDDFGFSLCKKTSDRYCQEMIQVYENKLKIISSANSISSDQKEKSTVNKTAQNVYDPFKDEINVFNKMELSKVQKYFEVLTTEISKNGNPYLTTHQLEQFIKRAFLGQDEIKKQTLNFGNLENRKIFNLFHSLFEYCSTKTFIEPYQKCKEKYVKLLTDNFTNFTFEQVFNNFEKRPKKTFPKNL